MSAFGQSLKTTFKHMLVMDTNEKHLAAFIIGQIFQVVLSVVVASTGIKLLFLVDHPLLNQLGFLSILGDLKFMAALALLVWVHEMSHMALFHRFGVPTFGVIFPPIGGIMVTGKATSPFQTVIVALAGPMSGLAAIPMLIWGTWQNQPLWTFLAFTWAVINLMNLIPIFPLDGGWVLKEIMTRWLSAKTATRISWILTILTISTLLWLVPDKKVLIIQLIFTGMVVVMDFIASRTFRWFSSRYKDEAQHIAPITTSEVSQSIAMYFAIAVPLALVVWLAILYLPGI